MTAPPDDLDEDRVQELQEGLRELADRTTLFFGQRPFVADFAAKALATLTAENKALRKALRDLAIDSAGFETATGRTWQQCLVCACKWATGDPEEHTDGCLAAGAANER